MKMMMSQQSAEGTYGFIRKAEKSQVTFSLFQGRELSKSIISAAQTNLLEVSTPEIQLLKTIPFHEPERKKVAKSI